LQGGSVNDTNHQQPATNKQPSTTNHKQTTTNNQPPTTDHQQTTNNQPPTTNHHQQPARNRNRNDTTSSLPNSERVSTICPSDELRGAIRYYSLALGIRPAIGLADVAPLANAVQSFSTSMAKVPVVPSQACQVAVTAAYLEEELQPPGPGTYERLSTILKQQGVAFAELGPHEACRTSEDSVRVRLAGGWQDVTLNSGAKAMLLRGGGGQAEQWLLAVLPADKKLSWKKVRALRGKGTRMATEEEVARVTGCVPGAVPPIAAAFPDVTECLADSGLPPVINFNCGLRTRSMQISRVEYERVQCPVVVDIAD